MLVMEYLPLGNLARQHYITEEENLQILCQGLQALEYLHSHSPPLAHRDIKPENILIRSRIPFVIKLVDFGLAKNDSTLKTFCGSNEYAAPEIWERHRYTEMVDIWSLGVVVLKYGYGLPRPSHKCKGKPWCRDIVQKAEDMEGYGDALIDLISTKMLRMDYRHRQSASDCLKEVYRLGFHEIQTVEIGRTTPTGKTTGRDGVTRTKSIIMQPLQNAPSDSDVTSGFYDVGGTSELTEVAPSKRDLREGINFYNRASPTSLDRYPQGPTQIWNPQIEDNPTSTLSKRRRPQLTQSPTADALGRGRSKRSRASISCEAGERLPKTSNPRQRFEQLERSISLNHEGTLATDVASLIQDVEPIPEVAPNPIRKPTRRPLGRSSVPAKEVSLREIEKPSEFFAINVLPHPILVRKSDFRINATHIFRAAGRLGHVRRKPEWASDIVQGGYAKHQGTYVDFEVGLELCQKYDLAILEKELRTLQSPSPVPIVSSMPIVSPPPVVKPPPAGFLRIDHLSETVMVLQEDFKINASNLLRVAGRPRTDMMAIKKGLPANSYKYIAGRSPLQGTYVIFTTGIELCRKHGLVDLEKQLLNLKSTSKEPVLEVPQNRIKPPIDIVRQLFENISPQPISTELNQAQTSRGPVSDGPTQPGHTYEFESDSDISGSDTGLSGKIQPNKANSIPSGGESPPAINSHYSIWNSEGTSGFTQAPRSLDQTEPVTYLDQVSMPTITLDNGQVPGPLIHGSSNLNRGDTGKISSLTQSDLRSNSSWASTVGKGVTYPGHYDDPTVETSF